MGIALNFDKWQKVDYNLRDDAKIMFTIIFPHFWASDAWLGQMDSSHMKPASEIVKHKM